MASECGWVCATYQCGEEVGFIQPFSGLNCWGQNSVIFLPGSCDAGQRVCPLIPAVVGLWRSALADSAISAVRYICRTPISVRQSPSIPNIPIPLLRSRQRRGATQTSDAIPIETACADRACAFGSSTSLLRFPNRPKTLLIARVTIGKRRFSGAGATHSRTGSDFLFAV